MYIKMIFNNNIVFLLIIFYYCNYLLYYYKIKNIYLLYINLKSRYLTSLQKLPRYFYFNSNEDMSRKVGIVLDGWSILSLVFEIYSD